ncbi:MAG: hypothetical protein ACRYFB_11305 [Janthinobacterium lividum]
MSIFLKQVIKYIFIIFSFGYAIIYVSILVKPGKMLGDATEYEIWKLKSKLTDNYYSKPQNIIIGDSRGMAALNPTIIKHNTINLSLGGATTFEGFSTIKKFLSQNRIDTLILCYGIFHYTESDVFENRTLLYQFNPIVDINNLEKVEKKYNITIDNKKPSYFLYLNRRSIYYNLPTNLRPTFLENLKQNNYHKYIIDILRENLGFCNFGKASTATGKDREVEIATEKKKFIINPILASYLDSIYDTSTRNHIKIAFVIPPINYSSYKTLKTTDYWKAYIKFRESLNSKYPEMEFYNKYTYLPDSYFGDPSHFNIKGSIFFSNYIKKELFDKDKLKVSM